MPIGLLAVVDPAAANPEGANAIMQIAGQFGIKPYLLLAQMVNFGIVAAILWFFVIKPIQKTLDERAGVIDEGLKRAEESQKTLAAAKAQKEEIINAARKEVQVMIEKAQKDLQEYSSSTRTEAQREAAELLEKARRDLIAENAQQISKAQQELAAIVVSLAEKSLEENLTEDQKQRFSKRVAETLK
jgi:F-type H+-transporting ATPase subunit b